MTYEKSARYEDMTKEEKSLEERILKLEANLIEQDVFVAEISRLEDLIDCHADDASREVQDLEHYVDSELQDTKDSIDSYIDDELDELRSTISELEDNVSDIILTGNDD